MTKITVQSNIDAPASRVWEFYTQPQHIIRWNNASPDWHTPMAENDVRVGGKFNFRMAAKDGSEGFDFTGEYTKVDKDELIEYIIADGRKVRVEFNEEDDKTDVKVTFDAEEINPVEMQRDGWQAILDNFKKYVESQ